MAITEEDIKATIEQDINDIETAIYGRDVRSAIADGIRHGYVNAHGAREDVAEFSNNVIKSQVTQPESQYNKVWLKPTGIDTVLAENSDIAPIFVDGDQNAYPAGSYVYYHQDKRLYRFNVDHKAKTAWNFNEVSESLPMYEMVAIRNNYAVPFDDSISYSAGWYTYYVPDNAIYRFLEAHAPNSGWDPTKVVRVTVCDELKRIENSTGTEISGLRYTIDNIENKFDTNLNKIAFKTEDAYYTQGTQIHLSSNWITYFFHRNDINAISEISCYSATNLTTYQIAFYSSEEISSTTFISAVNFVTPNVLNTITNIDIPDNCLVILISNRKTSGDVIIKGYTNVTVEALVHQKLEESEDYTDSAITNNTANNNSCLIFKNSFYSKHRMLFSAHRGAEGQAPYGSYPAYELACKQGWDMIQIAQARQSADGTWYCLHDPSVDAQTNGTGNIADLTDTYIATIYQDVGENVNQYTPEELRLPTLESVLQLAYRYGVMVSIRLGSLPPNANTGENRNAWNSFIALVKKYRPETMMFSGTKAQINMIKVLTANWHTQLYVTTDTVSDALDDLIASGFTNCSILAPREYVTKSIIADIHNAGMLYASTQIVNTTPTISDFITLKDNGCDIAQTGLSAIHSLSRDLNAIDSDVADLKSDVHSHDVVINYNLYRNKTVLSEGLIGDIGEVGIFYTSNDYIPEDSPVQQGGVVINFWNNSATRWHQIFLAYGDAEIYARTKRNSTTWGAWSKFAVSSFFANEGEITTDLDIVTKSGYYYLSNGAITNCPTSNGGMLIVYYGGSNYRLYQVVIEYDSGKIYVRNRKGNAFSTWKNIASPKMSISHNAGSEYRVKYNGHEYVISLYTNTSTNVDVWRLSRIYLNGVAISDAVTDFEGPIKEVGAADFVGGIHGDEKQDSVRFVIDGTEVLPENAFIGECSTFEVYVESTVYHCNTSNPVAKRNKILRFRNAEVTISNYWEFVDDANIQRATGGGLGSVYDSQINGVVLDSKMQYIPKDSIGTDYRRSKDLTEVKFETNLGGNVIIKNLIGHDSEHYMGWIQHFLNEQTPRTKAYLDYIYSDSGVQYAAGQTMRMRFSIALE